MCLRDKDLVFGVVFFLEEDMEVMIVELDILGRVLVMEFDFLKIRYFFF